MLTLLAALAFGVSATAAGQDRSPAANEPNPFDAPIKWTVVPDRQPVATGPAEQQQPDAAVPAEKQPDAAAPAQRDQPAPAVQTDQQPTAAVAAEQQRDPLAPLDDPATPSYVPSADAMRVMTWVAASGDNNAMPYMVIDKVAAEVFVFDSQSQLIAASPALVGSAVGDESSPDVGDRELSQIPLDERTTPAGRFVAKFGRAAGSSEVLWVDYPDAISLHAVITSNKREHRLQRLKSATPEDNRITHGCINVPADFYAKVVKPLFKDTSGVVYILPETKPLDTVFLAMPAQPQAAAGSPTSH
jgi:hypothetical protein